MNLSNNIKPPCGMKDFNTKEVYMRKHIVDIIQKCYEAHCGKLIDTPAIELQTTIHQLYGDEFNKLVYNIEHNDTEERLMMRYDLTVPFVRYVAEHGLKSFKRIQFGTVYRKDTPQMTLGRYRSFMQGDFDIIGDDQQTLIYDMEILDLLQDVMYKLLGDNFKIHLNHKQLIINLLEKCGVNKEQHNTVSSSIDKLDKKQWIDIKIELLEKQIDSVIVDSIEKFIVIMNNKKTDIFETLEELNKYGICDEKTYNDLVKIFTQLKNLNISQYFVFDPIIVRGMDYYTGIIYEVKYCDENIIGSTIAAGGRYDNMIKKMGNHDMPGIGLSIGIDRIMTIYEKTKMFENDLSPKIKYYVARIESNTPEVFNRTFELCSQIRRLGFSCEMCHLSNPKMGPQMKYALENNIPYMVIIGQTEIDKNTVQLKLMNHKKQIELDSSIFLQSVKDNIFM